MKLFYNPVSTNCRRVLATMYHLNSPVELQIVDFQSDELESPAFLKKNPNGMVPLLEEGSFCLSESNAIMQYLADKKGNTDLYPQEPKLRADVNRWQSWELAHLGPACRTFVWENVIKKMVQMGSPDPAALKEAATEFHQFGAVLNQHLQTHKYLLGDKVTLADYSVATHFMYAEPAQLPWGQFPNIKKWYAQIEALDAWKKSTPPKM